MKKRLIYIALAFAVILTLAVPAIAATGVQTIYLKGSGSKFDEKWKNVFTMDGDYSGTLAPAVWHLVYSGKNFSDVTDMQITFTNGAVFNWTPIMGPSVNNGGNNPGWVIEAPFGWEIAYVDKGNNNMSGSFVVTKDTKNVQFNISGSSKGVGLYFEIVKTWFDADGKKINMPNNQQNALFDVYVKKADTDTGEEIFEAIPNLQGVPAGKYPAKSGTYKVSERPAAGFTAKEQEKTLEIASRGQITVFAFENHKNSTVRGSIAARVSIVGKQPWIEYWPIYEKKVSEKKSLVSLSKNAFNNGHTWVDIDVAAARAGALTFKIADTSPQNTEVGYSYNVRIEDDKLIVFFDDKFISTGNGFGAYVVNDPKQFPGNAPSHPALGNSYGFDLPDGYGDTVYLYFHIDGGIRWLSLISNDVRTGEDTVGYKGVLTLTVTGPDGFKLVKTANYPDDIGRNGALWTLTDLALGEYTLVLRDEGFDDAPGIIKKTITVTKDNPNATADFGTFTFTFETKEVWKNS